MSNLGEDASLNRTVDISNALHVTAVTGTSNTLFLDVSDAVAGRAYQLIYTDQTAVNIPYEAKNKVTVKNFKFNSTYADLSLNDATSGRITLTGTNVYDGARMGVVLKDTEDSSEDVSFNNDTGSGGRPLINGGLFAPASNYVVSMHPTSDPSDLGDASLSLNFGGAISGRGVDASAVHILYTDRTSLETYTLTHALSGTQKATGVLDDIVGLSGVRDKSYEFAVRFEDELGAYTQWVGAENSAERTAAPSKVRNVDVSGQDKGVNGAGGILQVYFAAPTYAPNPITGYHIYYIQRSDASGGEVFQTHATKVSVGTDVSHNISVANSVANDVSSNYHVWVAAVSNVDGVPTEGPLDKDVNEAVDTSNVAVTGRPEAPTLVSVATGQDIDAANTLTDASMTGRALITYNDANKSNRGLQLDGAKVAVFRKQDVSALPTLILDGSYNSNLAGAIIGQDNDIDANLESIDISGSSALQYILDASGNWAEANGSNGVGLADGTEYVAYIALANNNGAGLGAPSAMFKPSGLADIAEMRILGDADAEKLSGVSGNHYIYPTDVSFVQPGNNKITLRLTTADVCGNDTSALFGGLPALSGIEYAVYGDGANTDSKRFVGSAPANNDLLDICGGDNVENTAQLHRTLPISSTGLYDITHYYDASGILQPLVNGTVYNVEAWARNANTIEAGAAGARSFKFTGIAPMGALGSATSITNSSTAASLNSDKLELDISLNDPSGNAFTGGHIVAGYKCLGKQTVGGIERTVFDQTIIFDSSTDPAVNGTNLTRKLECRGGANDANAAFGYPVNVTITPFADASNGGVYGKYDASNNTQFLGSPATTILTGPVVGSGNYDEVGALTVTEIDSQLDVFFTPASVGGFSSSLTDVVLDSYTVELYDASFGTGSANGEFSTNGKLATLVATEIIPHNAQSTEYSKSFEQLVNGHAYIIRVVTNFTQGPPTNRVQSSTKGLWFGKGEVTTVPVAATSNPGFFDFTQANDAGGVDQNFSETLAGEAAVPRGIPVITADIQQNKLEIVTNGSGALSYAAMIQVLPASGVSVTGQENSFYLDLASGGNGSSVNVIAGNPNNKKVTIATNTLGTNWVNEKNYIFASNEAGTRVVTTNITNAASNGALVSLF